MDRAEREEALWARFRHGRIGRRALLRGLLAAGGYVTLSAAGAG